MKGLVGPAVVAYVPTTAVGPRVVGCPDAVRSVFQGVTPWHWSKIAVASRPVATDATVGSPAPAFANASRTAPGRLNCVV